MNAIMFKKLFEISSPLSPSLQPELYVSLLISIHYVSSWNPTIYLKGRVKIPSFTFLYNDPWPTEE